MRFLSSSALLGAFLVMGCSAKPNYDDDVAQAPVLSEFHCAKSPTAPACVVLKDFESAGKVTGYPKEGASYYLGESLCTKVFPTRTLRLIVLRPGNGADARVDEAHRPAGALEFGSIMLSKSLGGIVKAIDKTLESVRAGHASPGIEELSEAERKEAAHVVPMTWAAWKASAHGSVRGAAQSDGISLLLSPGSKPAMLDDAKVSSAGTFLRQHEDGRLLGVTPASADSGAASCVFEARPLPKGP